MQALVMTNPCRKGASWKIASVLIGAAALIACGGGITSNGLASCVTGQQSACACSDGSTGVQVCSVSQTYDPCVCASDRPSDPGSSGVLPPPSDPAADASVPPPTVTDASATPPGDVSACPPGGNVLVLDGEVGDYIHPGLAKITAAAWSSSASSAHTTVAFNLTPSAPGQGLWWDVELSSEQLSAPLAVGTYLNAQRAPFADPSHAGLEVGGDGRGCNTLTGSFSIAEITWDGSALTHVLASFEQHCEGGPKALRGCVRYDKP